MFCSKCGEKIPEGSNFCPGCGVSVNSSIETLTEQSTPFSSRVVEPKKKSKILRILLWLFLAIVLVIGFAIISTSALVDVTENHLSSLRSNDVSAAYKYTSKRFRKVTPLPTFEKFISSYPILTEHESFSVGGRQFSGNTGSVEGTLTSEKHGVANIEFQMIKEGDDWRIQGFDLE